MAQVLVRDIDPQIVERLKRRAQENHRSLEAELRSVLEKAAIEAGPSRAEVAATIDRMHAMFAGREFPNSAELLREDRDR